MDLHTLLIQEGINPDSTLVMRHCPLQPQIRKWLPSFAAENPEIYNAYQQCQSPRAERQLTRARHLASFIGHEPGRALFVGVYENGVPRKVTQRSRDRIPAYKKLTELGLANNPGERLWFDLHLTATLERWRGKLVIKWPGREVSFSRWAHKDSQFEVDVIYDESWLTPSIPDWRTLVLKFDELHRIPKSWKAALREWCGIYYLFDTGSGTGYVGSACGKENLLGRWLAYAKTGHGGNRKLRGLKPEGFVFSILERMSQDIPQDELNRRENEWKVRLHTREYGLNDN